MGKIHKLNSGIVNQIAAGEVVIQPASVIKELVENSFDAGASRVGIEFMGSGADFLSISDNGCGMSEEDLLLSIESHATSKISSAADLYTVTSCGFRGEALASIAEVSQIEITSLASDEKRPTKLSLSNGKASLSPASRERGTTITVKNLFHNVPVRRRFLKSDRAESTQNLSAIKKLALARPFVAFDVKRDGKEVFRLSEDQSLEQRVRDLSLFEKKPEFIHLKAEDGSFQIEGLLVAPPQNFGNSQKIHLFVNRRPIFDRSLHQAIIRAFSGYLPERRFPGAVIFLKMPAEEVDVNIHPTKSEVRFRQSENLFRFIHSSVKNHLLDGAQISDSQPTQSVIYKSTGLKKIIPMNRSYGGLFDQGEKPRPFSDSPAPFQGARSAFEPKTESFESPHFEIQEGQEPYPLSESKGLGESPFELPKKIKAFQLLNRFIIIEKDGHFELMDQHAIHERILYNQLLHEERDRIADSQQLLGEIEVILPEGLSELSEEVLSSFHKMGYRVRDLQENQKVFLEAVPDYLNPEKAIALFKELLDEISNQVYPSPSDLRVSLLQSMACKAAIKAGDPLSEDQLQNIVAATMSMKEHQGCCPHGRNAIWKISIAEANSMFDRT